jgi:hypothetical protein
MGEFQYDAFVSYRRSDGTKVARWIRRELESYRAPRSLRDRFERKLRVYLDTAYESGTSDFYEHNIKPALLASRFFLIVATPAALRRPGAAAGEDWIEREVQDFTSGPNANNVIAIRAAGEFDDPLPADLHHRFPNIEIIDLRGAGRLWFLHPTRAARLASEKLKLVAPLLGLPPQEMPRLRQEEELRQQTRLGVAAGAALGVLVAVSGLSVFALQSRNHAIRTAEDSMFAAGGMALRAAGLDPEDSAATERTRHLMINQGCDLVDRFQRGTVSEPQIDEIVMCHRERALEHERLGEKTTADRLLTEAIELADARYRKFGRLGAALRLLEARHAYADYLLRQRDATAAKAQYQAILNDSQRFEANHGKRSEWTQWAAEAQRQIAPIDGERGPASTTEDGKDSASKSSNK